MRKGFTLIELLISLAIIAVLLALLLSGVIKVRVAASRVVVQNKLRQLGQAVHNFTSAYDTRLPDIDGVSSVNRYQSVCQSLVPYLEQLSPNIKGTTLTYGVFQSDHDPSYAAFPNQKGNTSFSFNGLVFLNPSRLADVSDGTSNTIAIGERYARCSQTDVQWSLYSTICISGGVVIPCTNYTERRASFSDKMYDDHIPDATFMRRVQDGQESLTFQSAPSPQRCDVRVLQAPFGCYLNVALLDGSVRTIRRQISPYSYWSLVTPKGNEPGVVLENQTIN